MFYTLQDKLSESVFTGSFATLSAVRADTAVTPHFHITTFPCSRELVWLYWKSHLCRRWQGALKGKEFGYRVDQRLTFKLAEVSRERLLEKPNRDSGVFCAQVVNLTLNLPLMGYY